MRRCLFLFLAFLLLPVFSFADSAVDSARFFYTFGVWESGQAEDSYEQLPMTLSAQGSETVYQLGQISVGAAADHRVFLIRAELDASNTQSVQTMVSLCAALSEKADFSSDRALALIQFLGEAAERSTSEPAMLGDYEIHVQSDGSTIYFSALLQDYEQGTGGNATLESVSAGSAAPETVSGSSAPATVSAGTAGSTVRVSTSGGSLRLRADTSEKAKILARIRNSTELTLLEWGEEWSRVQYKKQTGYVMTKYLSAP